MDTIIFFCFGLIIGSFLNVVILRYGSGLPLANDRSRCFSCNKTLSFFELIPLLSYIFLLGRCRSCKSKISIQYPLVEFFTGLLFALTYQKLSVFMAPIYLWLTSFFLVSVLVVITVYDFRHKIIPDLFAILFALSAFIYALPRFFFEIHFSHTIALTNLLSGLILFLPFFAMWYFSGGRLIGLGDGKLAVGIGTLLGLSGGLSAVTLAFWIGSVVMLPILILEKFGKKSLNFASPLRWLNNLSLESEVPFGPFLVLATMIVFFHPLDIFSLYLWGL